ncbi:hypothetical protein [Chelativorans salis]|uniref:Uncharacterized protein n=1 Tax=Chelativorans salis TaxID=2978478 RepID=A0ABT2LMZ6_9HYPH|nr:hypothetical protein [Chelativorans sp. EGI FJ00035]MCO0638064.1 hypothetical protein [Lutimaribacter sp. EGI FJ00014]MCT7375893.1 hypothetical protein [Chelativorans sp. EGI FJ00035]
MPYTPDFQGLLAALVHFRRDLAERIDDLHQTTGSVDTDDMKPFIEEIAMYQIAIEAVKQTISEAD